MSNPSSETIAALTAHQWSPQPKPARLVRQLLEECLEQSSYAAQLSQRMLTETGTRMVDWIDHFAIPENDPLIPRLREVGYQPLLDAKRDTVWSHPGGLFPRIRQTAAGPRQLMIKVESVVDFLFVHNLTGLSIEGAAFSPLRRVAIAINSQWKVGLVERHGCHEFEVAHLPVMNASLPSLVARHYESMKLRRRDFKSDAEGFAHANQLIDAAIKDLGRDRACDIFFTAEREYWQRRNRAGQIQFARQERLGLGWANHDHHTYRSSRSCFAPLIAVCEKLGFQCRERFYAGKEAGWGAQVIEHPITGVTIFADVDLSPEELALDFSHIPLTSREELGTVGLWCALHGEAFLQAGLHHLECQFDFSETSNQLKEAGIETMPPFTDFPYLRQAFTRGEQWYVNPSRIEALRSANRITDAQAKQFLQSGALGSHMEILQRDDGYKGFNQKGINEIITATDPRHARQT